MAEDLKTIPRIEGQEAPKDALSEVIKKLGISPETIQKIQGLDPENKELCKISLEDILKETEQQKLGPTDRNEKIKNTLEKEYNIPVTFLESKDNQREYAKRHEELQKNLESVRKLDPTIVGKELANAKASNPLPNEVKLTIAKSSNSTPEQVDEAIKSGNNPQISNLVDTYYLSQASTIDAISKKLPEGKITTEFQELRASAREFGLPYTERADNVKALITNQSDATQGKVIETVNSLTKGAPDTLITRDGDRLTWEDKTGSKYEIDMAVRPPKLTKSLGLLSLSRTEHEENPEVKTLQQDIESNKKELNTTKGEVSKSLENSGVYGFNPDNYTPDELRKMFSGVEISTFEQKLNDAKTTEQQISLKEELKNNREGSGGKLNKVAIQYMEYILDERIQMGNSGIEGVSSMDTVSSKDWIEKLTSLKEFKSSNKLEEYAKEKESLEKKEKKLGEIKSPSIEDFDARAEDTLRKLDSLGFDKIGQENLNALIRGLGARDNNVGIWESGEINMDDSIVREAQLKDLEQVAQSLKKERANNPNTKDENSLENVFSDISKMLKGNDAFRNLWNSPNGLASWIKKQGVQNETPKTNSNKINTLK